MLQLSGLEIVMTEFEKCKPIEWYFVDGRGFVWDVDLTKHIGRFLHVGWPFEWYFEPIEGLMMRRETMKVLTTWLDILNEDVSACPK